MGPVAVSLPKGDSVHTTGSKYEVFEKHKVIGGGFNHLGMYLKRGWT